MESFKVALYGTLLVSAWTLWFELEPNFRKLWVIWILGRVVGTLAVVGSFFCIGQFLTLVGMRGALTITASWALYSLAWTLVVHKVVSRIRKLS